MTKSSMSQAPHHAPIALFTFKRPEHTKRTLEALALNPQFAHSPLYIFCDGARNESEAAAVEASRQVARNWKHAHKVVVEAPRNQGLANSVIAGVTRLCAEHGRVIVMEDDLLVSPVFLAYMNEALQRYADSDKVMQVTGHMWPIEVAAQSDAFFMPITNSLGWGTWQRAWAKFDSTSSAWKSISTDKAARRRFDLGGRFPFSAMLEKQLRGGIDSWAIRWYLSVFAHQGLVLYPTKNLVVNIGFDGVGTHSIAADQQRYGSTYSSAPVVNFPLIQLDDQSTEKVSRFLARDGSLGMRVLRRIKRMMGVLR